MTDSPAEGWTEAMLEALEPHEHDFQEFKGSPWMVDDEEELVDHFLVSLSKQVSAFANGAGGRLIIGLDDNGVVDGGVPVDLKGGGTRAWLEDVVPQVVDPPLQRCNVFEVGHRPQNSLVNPGHAVYVVEIPSSARAPHQAKDHRYYLRIAGKSRPMGHVHIQDVLRRTHHPQVEVSRLGPYGDAELDTSDPRGPQAFVQLRAFVVNRSRRLASHVGIELLLPRPFAGSTVRRRMATAGECQTSQTPGEVTYFRYHGMPIFPSQEIYAVSVWMCIHSHNLALLRSGASLGWMIYADDAVPARGDHRLASFAVVQHAMRWVEAQLTG
ncbi:MAG: ATP-binding protein [Myxococcales bacterium]|nr:ATP-binding protein [Myxococcales bacterium]